MAVDETLEATVVPSINKLVCTYNYSSTTTNHESNTEFIFPVTYCNRTSSTGSFYLPLNPFISESQEYVETISMNDFLDIILSIFFHGAE